jgi:dTDP-4-amino-4,6-dideoxygalactose transaminase
MVPTPHPATDEDRVEAPPASAPAARIPVLRPQLPRAQALLAYLERIDAQRVYANFGPLVLEFERRLVGHFRQPEGALVSASSGTAALVAAILAGAGRATAARPLALMPAYTFVATAVAAEQCGFQPALADVDALTWALDPDRLRDDPLLARAGVVIVVAPYGRAFDQAAWAAFARDTGVPVVIDAAAAFEALGEDPGRSFGPVPVVVSFHATKSFATGEGGAVVCTDIAFVERAGQALNYGFSGSRESRMPSTNGKMSEYHAAVGLAELDAWPHKQRRMHAVADQYRRQLAARGLAAGLVAAPEISSSYVLWHAADAAEAAAVRRAFDRNDIGYRLWYGDGLARQPHFASAPSGSLDHTDAIAARLLGIPTAPDLGPDEVARVVAARAAAVAEAACAVRPTAPARGWRTAPPPTPRRHRRATCTRTTPPRMRNGAGRGRCGTAAAG